MSLPQDFIDTHKAGVVLGLQTIDQTRPRLDIDKLLSDFPDTFNLFLLALAELQNDAGIMGYYQIAGIHGLPQSLWDDVKDKANLAKEGELEPSGYCAHGTQKFPTWHRPYLAMIEQAIFIKMFEIANLYNEPHKSNYIEAAKLFRLPFWDYYRPRGLAVAFPGVIDNGMTKFSYDYSCPKILTASKVMIKKHPDNSSEPSDNPLSTYHFQPDLKDFPWDKVFPGNLDPELLPRDHTARYPKLVETKFGDSVQTLNNVLNSLRMDSNSLALTMLVDKLYDNYGTFSTDGIPFDEPPGGPANATEFVKAYGSLEALHGMYHVLIGGAGAPNEIAQGGHMSRVPTAAFDPVFWMHHCQVDRLFALWQATHQDKSGNWFSDADAANEGLIPFRKERPQAGQDNVFWNSNDSRTTEAFGYRYDEAVGDAGTVKQRLEDMYRWSIPTNRLQDVKAPADMEPINVDETQFFKNLPGSVPAPVILAEANALKELPALQTSALKSSLKALPALQKDGYVREWYIDDEVHRLALNGSFTIFYFIASKDENGDKFGVPGTDGEENYSTQPNLAGMHHVFAAPVEMCDNCGYQSEQAQTVSTTIPITSFLIDFVANAGLEDLESVHVNKFLKERLRWRVVTVNGEVVDPRRLAQARGFKIGISSKVTSIQDPNAVTYEDHSSVIDEIMGNASDTADTAVADLRL